MWIRPFIIAILLSTCAAAACISTEQAAQRIGKNECVAGKVLKVGASRSGNFYLDFCHDYRKCPFTVFVPAKKMPAVGDVRQLEGKNVEIYGKIRQYAGHAEIVLKDKKQLQGEAAKIPPAPKKFDAEREGHVRTGRFTSPKTKYRTH